jgi:hypothetical protein
LSTIIAAVTNARPTKVRGSAAARDALSWTPRSQRKRKGDAAMVLSLFDSKGTALERQHFTWKEVVQKPISKLDDDAFTRVRVILMKGQETEALRFGHAYGRMNRNMQIPLAEVRRVEQHQQTMVNWLIGADHSPLETTSPTSKWRSR